MDSDGMTNPEPTNPAYAGKTCGKEIREPMTAGRELSFDDCADVHSQLVTDAVAESFKLSAVPVSFFNDSVRMAVDAGYLLGLRDSRARVVEIIEDKVPHDGYCAMGDCTGCQIIGELLEAIND